MGNRIYWSLQWFIFTIPCYVAVSCPTAVAPTYTTAVQQNTHFSHFGYCWYAAESRETCSDACSRIGSLSCSDTGMELAVMSMANCRTVATGLGLAFSIEQDFGSSTGYGCTFGDWGYTNQMLQRAYFDGTLDPSFRCGSSSSDAYRHVLCPCLPEQATTYIQFGTGPCRGASPTDNPSTWYELQINFIGNLHDCEVLCSADSSCVAIEYIPGGPMRCELWSQEPQHFAYSESTVFCNKKQAATCASFSCPSMYVVQNNASTTVTQDNCCQASCTVPTITQGVGAWGGANCQSGASNVVEGTTCQITADSGYACTSPGLCQSDGQFAHTGKCEAIAIMIAGASGNSKAVNGYWERNGTFNGKPKYEKRIVQGSLMWEGSNDWAYSGMGTPQTAKWTIGSWGHHRYYNEEDTITPPLTGWNCRSGQWASGSLTLEAINAIEEYYFNSRGVNCPIEQRVSEAECQQAALQYSITYRGDISDTTNRPAGCYMDSQGGNEMWYNVELTAPNGRPCCDDAVCKQTTTTTSATSSTSAAVVTTTTITTIGTTAARQVARTLSGQMTIQVTNAARFVQEPNLTVVLRRGVADLYGNGIVAAWVHNLTVKYNGDGDRRLVFRSYSDEEHRLFFRGSYDYEDDRRLASLAASGEVDVEWKIEMPPESEGEVIVEVLAETFDAKTMSEATQAINAMINSGLLGDPYTVNVTWKYTFAEDETATAEEASSSTGDSSSILVVLVVVCGSVALVALLSTLFIARWMRNKEKARQQHPFAKLGLLTGTDAKKKKGDGKKKKDKKQRRQFSMSDLLNPPDAITAKEGQDVREFASGLLDDVSVGLSAKIFVAYSSGKRDADAVGYGPGTYYAAAILKTLTESGITCFSELMLPDDPASRHLFCAQISGRGHGCEILIVLQTKALYNDRYSLREMYMAQQAKVEILPLRFEDDLPNTSDVWPSITRQDMEGMLMVSSVVERFCKLNSIPSPPYTVVNQPAILQDMVTDLKLKMQEMDKQTNARAPPMVLGASDHEFASQDDDAITNSVAIDNAISVNAYATTTTAASIGPTPSEKRPKKQRKAASSDNVRKDKLASFDAARSEPLSGKMMKGKSRPNSAKTPIAEREESMSPQDAATKLQAAYRGRSVRLEMKEGALLELDSLKNGGSPSPTPRKQNRPKAGKSDSKDMTSAQSMQKAASTKKRLAV